MAAVWLGDDERLDRPVAVKLLSDTLIADPGYLARFRREARVAAGLQHPHLVAIYDFDAGERPYLVMEYIEGGDLARRLEEGGAPDAELLARELLAALRHIHAAGVLHRDIKPQNVLIDRHGSARLTDFGIAQPRDATSLTRTGEVIGTQSYIAPEVLAGEPASEASDLYALGTVLAEAASAGAGATFWELTDRMRDPDPERRPPSAAAALAELERNAPGLPGTATQPFAVLDEVEQPSSQHPFEPTPTATRRTPRRGVTAALAGVALAVAAAVVLAIVAGGGDPGERAAGTANDAKAGKSQAGDGGNAASASADGQASTAEPSAAATTSDQAVADTAEPSGAATTSGQAVADTTGLDGAALNDQGYSLVNAGSYEDAVPVLERAVNALRGSGDETTYNYALYNLGTAYLGAGRPEDAIPVLEERMRFDDGQLAEVQATLDEAHAAAGAGSAEADGG